LTVKAFLKAEERKREKEKATAAAVPIEQAEPIQAPKSLEAVARQVVSQGNATSQNEEINNPEPGTVEGADNIESIQEDNQQVQPHAHLCSTAAS
jgi:hypothetical protein